MNRLTFSAALLALAATACTAPTTDASASRFSNESPVTASPRLVFQPRCVSVWDLEIDGRETGLVMFTDTSETWAIDVPAGSHEYVATRWAPGPAGSLRDSVAVPLETVVALPCR
jgi:hypothetical protein